MPWFDAKLDALVAEARQVFGEGAAVSVIESDAALEHLARLSAAAHTDAWLPLTELDRDHAREINWFGTLDLWADTDHRVVIRRVTYLAVYGDLQVVSLAAARTAADIERALLHARTLWSAWRRERAKIQNARGADLDIAAVDWSDVYLPASTLDDIRANVVRFRGARALYQRLNLPYRRGFLLYGPPGNGKTMVCRAIVTALGWPVVYVSPESRKDASDEIAYAFSQARDLAPCVLWFDDVDSLFDTDATMSSFLNRLDGATSATGTLVLATTNHPEKLDPALVARPSRFDRLFEIGLPGSPERDRYFAARFGDALSPADREELVRRTSGMSMAFVQEVFVGAALRAAERGDPPTADDAFAVHDALHKHLRVTARGFESSAPTGFGRT